VILLVDTSVWIEHLLGTLPELSQCLEQGTIAIHPWVIGELACVNLQKRQLLLDLLKALPPVAIATDRLNRCPPDQLRPAQPGHPLDTRPTTGRRGRRTPPGLLIQQVFPCSDQERATLITADQRLLRKLQQPRPGLPTAMDLACLTI
jgi:hypothetical protein